MNILRHYFNLAKFAISGDKGFYAAREYLAQDLIGELEEFIDLQGKKVLDVGGERGEFAKILAERRNCQAVNLEPKRPVLGDFVWKTIIGSADKLPFKDKSFDLVLLRGVIQHIPTEKKLKVLKEIHRVLKNSGTAYVMIPPWYNPLSGQTIKPFQYFPYKVARHLRNSVFNSSITADSLVELGLWPMTFRRTLKLIDQANFKILKTTDILFKIHFITKIPALREFLLPSVGFILKK
ncbi:MAG: class I SAM-dependent methyltransferase [Patescibacteria group bacterium]|nr:class I SAM-dependent methyltransferase [Patescibacteria group bacterium]